MSQAVDRRRDVDIVDVGEEEQEEHFRYDDDRLHPSTLRRYYRHEHRRQRRRIYKPRRLLPEVQPGDVDKPEAPPADNEVAATQSAANWRMALGMFFIHLAMPGIISSFGVFMLHLSPKLSLELMFIVPLINIAFCTLNEPFWRQLLFVLGTNHHLALGVSVVSMAIITLNQMSVGVGMMMATYGFCGGFGESGVATYVTGMMDHYFPNYRGLVVAYNYLGSAIGYIVVPMGIHMLLEHYTFDKTAVIQGVILAIVFTIAIWALPAWIPIPVDSTHNEEAQQSWRINCSRQNSVNEWITPRTMTRSELNYYDETDMGERGVVKKWTLRRSRERYPPVVVMPRIIEEGEGELQEVLKEEVHCNNESIEVQEDECFKGDDQHESKVASEANNSEYDPTELMISHENIHKNVRIISVKKVKSQKQESAYEPTSRRDDYVKQFCIYTCCPITRFIFKTSSNPLKTPFFFSELWIKFSVRFCSVTFTTLLPILSKTITPTNSNETSISGLMVAGLSALCTLPATRYLRRVREVRQKYVLSLGCFIEGVGYYLLTVATNEDYVKVGCLFYGVGASITACSVPLVLITDLGIGNQKRTALTRDILCTVLICFAALAVLIVWRATEAISNIFYVLVAIQMVSSLVWIIRPFKSSYGYRHTTPLIEQEDIIASPTYR